MSAKPPHICLFGSSLTLICFEALPRFDKATGRIYRVRPKDYAPAMPRDLARIIAPKLGGESVMVRIKEITGGKSLESNIELVLNNAKLAAQLAVALANLPI